VEVTLGSYGRYIGTGSANGVVFSATVLLFVCSELVLTFFLRFLAKYELVKNGEENLFGSSFTLFWGVLGLMVALYFVTLVLKYLLLQAAVLNSNTAIH
jgi:hypothetical protein